MAVEVGTLEAVLRLKDELSAQMKIVMSNLESARGRFDQLGGTAAKAGLALSAGLTAPLAGVGMAAVKLAGDYEQTRMAFTSMLGGAQRADKFLREMKDFAAKTPFEFAGLMDSTKLMMAMGFEVEKLEPMLRGLGDAASALGGGNELIGRLVMQLGQMQAKGKVSAEEMRVLAQTGIPVWEILSQKIGVSIPQAMKMAEKGAISSTQGIEALMAGITEKFGGMMEVQSQTMLGRWSTLKDEMSFALMDVGDALLPIAKKLVDALINLVPVIKSITQAFADLPGPVQAVIVGLGAILAAAGPALLAFGGISMGVAALIPLLPALGTAFTVATGPVGAAVVLFGALVYALGGPKELLRLFSDAAYLAGEASASLRDQVASLIDSGIDNLKAALETVTLGVISFKEEIADNKLNAFEQDLRGTTSAVFDLGMGFQNLNLLGQSLKVMFVDVVTLFLDGFLRLMQMSDTVRDHLPAAFQKFVPNVKLAIAAMEEQEKSLDSWAESIIKEGQAQEDAAHTAARAAAAKKAAAAATEEAAKKAAAATIKAAQDAKALARANEQLWRIEDQIAQVREQALPPLERERAAIKRNFEERIRAAATALKAGELTVKQYNNQVAALNRLADAQEQAATKAEELRALELQNKLLQEEERLRGLLGPTYQETQKTFTELTEATRMHGGVTALADNQLQILIGRLHGLQKSGQPIPGLYEAVARAEEEAASRAGLLGDLLGYQGLQFLKTSGIIDGVINKLVGLLRKFGDEGEAAWKQVAAAEAEAGAAALQGDYASALEKTVQSRWKMVKSVFGDTRSDAEKLVDEARRLGLNVSEEYAAGLAEGMKEGETVWSAVIGDLPGYAAQMGANLSQMGDHYGAFFGQIVDSTAEGNEALSGFMDSLLEELGRGVEGAAEAIGQAVDLMQQDLRNGMITSKQYVEQMANTIAGLSDAISMGDTGAFETLQASIDETMEAFESGALSGQEAASVLGDAFSALGDAAAAGMEGAREEMLAMVRETRAAGLEVEEVSRHVRESLSKAVTGLEKLPPIVTQEDAKAQAQLFAATWHGVVQEQGLFAAIEQMGDAYDRMREQGKAAGVDIGAIMGPRIGELMEAARSETLGPILQGVDALQQVIGGLADSGYLTAGALEGGQQQALAMAERLAEGGLSKEAMAQAMGPTLAELAKTAEMYGKELSPEVQALIDELGIETAIDPAMTTAEAITGDVVPALWQMVELQGGVAPALDDLSGKMGALGPEIAAMTQTAGAMEAPAEPVFSFAGGTNGLMDFRGGTTARLHDVEAVVRGGDYSAMIGAIASIPGLVSQIAASLGDRAPSDGTPINVNVIIDGQVLGTANARSARDHGGFRKEIERIAATV